MIKNVSLDIYLLFTVGNFAWLSIVLQENWPSSTA